MVTALAAPAVTHLRELIGRLATRPGANGGLWPGLTLYRFEERTRPAFSEVQSVALGMIGQGRKRVRIGPADYFYDPLSYLIITRGLRFQSEVLQATREAPFLSLVLEIPMTVVTGVVDSMNRGITPATASDTTPVEAEVYVTPVDTDMTGAVCRFLDSLDAPVDREVLAPLFLREITYRLLRSEQRMRVLRQVLDDLHPNAIAAAIRLMRQEKQRPLTVRAIADTVCMSESAFAHLFKATTGLSPLKVLRQFRMAEARELLQSGYSCGEVANRVGYSSLSHFAMEFKRHYGDSPRSYRQRGERQAPVAQAIQG
jgi:AraC-like DNA-binding protein